MRRTGRWVRGIAFAVGLVLILAGVGGLLLVRTAPGRALVLDQVMTRARALLAGSLEVERFGEGDLLERTALVGVRLTDARGVPVLEADSVLLSYSAWSLLRGARELAGVDIHGATVRLQADDTGWNVARLLKPADTAAGQPERPAADSATAALTAPGGFVLRNVSLHDSRLAIEPLEGAPTRVRGLEAELPRVALGGADGIDRIEIYRAAFEAELLAGTLVVHELVGGVEREGNRVHVDVARLRLPESEVRGEVDVAWDTAGVVTELTVTSGDVEVADLWWLEPDLPRGRLTGRLDARLSPAGSRWTFADARFLSGASAVDGSGSIVLEPRLRLDDLELEAQRFDVGLLSPWLPDTLWTWARLDGTLSADGTPDRLAVVADLQVVDPDVGSAPTRLQLDGGARLAGGLGARTLRLRAGPLAPALLSRVGGLDWLDSPPSVDVTLDGTIEEGLRILGEATLGDGEETGSRVRADLVVQTADEAPLQLSGTLDLDPLRLPDLDGLAPGLALQGLARGRVDVGGTPDALTLSSDLQTSGGPLGLVAVLGWRGERRTLDVQGALDELDLSRLSGRVPERSTLAGAVGVTVGPEPGVLSATLDLAASRLAGIRVERARSDLRVVDGRLHLDSLEARSALGDLRARGSLALDDVAEDAELTVDLTDGSLVGLRPLVFGEEGELPVGLEELRLRLASLDGTASDTATVDLAGAFELHGTLRGSLDALVGEGRVDLRDVVYQDFGAARLTALVDAFRLASGDLDARVDATDVTAFARPFDRATGTVALAGGRGRVVVEFTRPSGTVFAAGEIEADSSTTLLHLDQFNIVDLGDRWRLGGPARLAWGPEGLEVRDLRVLRPGEETFEVNVDGTLPRDGSGGLRVDVRALDLARISRIVAFQENDIEGLVDLDLDVRGSLSAPAFDGTLAVRQMRYRVVRFDELGGELHYQDRTLRGSLVGVRGSRRSVRIEGSVPADLALGDVETRIPEGPVRVSLQADSVPLANVLGFFPGYERVEGELSGNFVVSGTPSDLQPSGLMRLSGGAATVREFGIRPTDGTGTFELTPDGIVTVDATVRERGQARVSGRINLNPITDPGFDLDVTTVGGDDIRIAARREMEARVSGQVHLGGSYQRPELTGAIAVREGVLYLDEFVRAATIVDLSDPALIDLDRELLALDPIVRESQNPFVQNLRVTVDVRLDGNAWLRSPEMNVEMAGDLLLTFDRAGRTVAMLGDLTALRGTYRVVGRQFEVEDGTVRFLGTPGVNPTLEITAQNRLRVEGGSAVDITAAVTGTMLRPEVALTSDLPGATREDLISYLLFGRPQAALTQLASQSGSVLGSAGLSLTLGALASQVGSLVADELPFDYLSVSTQQAFSGGVNQNALRSGFRSTEVEVGKYVLDDVFLALVLRPFDADRLSGFRMEWRLSDQVGVEGFVENRLAQLGASFDGLLFQLRRVIGFRLFREWGY
ncbi:MAG: translocation/assembly module TamB [Gemmatimonadota bacterium]